MSSYIFAFSQGMFYGLCESHKRFITPAIAFLRFTGLFTACVVLFWVAVLEGIGNPIPVVLEGGATPPAELEGNPLPAELDAIIDDTTIEVPLPKQPHEDTSGLYIKVKGGYLPKEQTIARVQLQLRELPIKER
jgi:hypothetical protein